MIKRIFDDGSLRATHHIPEKIEHKDIIFITFQTLTGRLSDSGFGTEFLNKNGIENILISHKGRSFYQKLSINKFKEIVSECIEGKKIFLYGSSLGGYAAIYYSGVVKGQAISISPRCSADPILKINTEVEFLHTPLCELEENLVSNKAPVIAYDPEIKLDQLFLTSRIIPCYPDSKIWEIPGGMHPVTRCMSNSKVLKEFVFGVINSENIKEGLNVDITTNPGYTFKMGMLAIKDNNIESANDNLFKCLKWGGNRKVIILIRKLIDSGNLKYKISSSDIPQSAKNFHFENLENLDASSSNDVIRYLHEILEYDSALAIIHLKLQKEINDRESLIRLRREIINERNLIEKLQLYNYNYN